MSAFQLFTTQLDCGATDAAIDAMKRLRVVAASMSAKEVSDKLLPCLTSIALKQPPHPDELLLLLGQHVPSVAAMLHVNQTAHFLPLLERLCAVEETVVREQAVQVLSELCGTVAANAGSGKAGSAADIGPWMGLTKRLGAADWFTAKVSAAGVVAPVFALCTAKGRTGKMMKSMDEDAATSSSSTYYDQQLELLSLYKDLCSDDTPMVRRAAAKHLGSILAAAGWSHRDFCAATLPALCHDEQDSVRQLAVAALANAGKSFGKHPQWTCQFWMPIVKDGSTDMSWRVRHNLAKHFSDVANNMGIHGGATTSSSRGGNSKNNSSFQAEQSLVMACFVSLLTDTEAEVRAAAVGHLARMVTWGGPALFAAHLQPLLPALADDVVMEVRSKCALALMDSADSGTLEDSVILASFGPLLESFLQDEFHEVQLQVLTHLDKISHLLPALAGVVQALIQMSKASNWRVRQAVARMLPHLAEARGMEFFTTVLLEPAWLTLLLDPVSQVRLAIVQGMPLLAKVAGPEWVLKQLLPQHVRIYNAHASSYLIRITVLQAHIETMVTTTASGNNNNNKAGDKASAAGALTSCGQHAGFWNEVVLQQIVNRCLSDKVANVRMVAATGLMRILVAYASAGGNSKGSSTEAALVQTQVRPALEKRLAEEEDADARAACQSALDAIQ